MRTKKPIHVYDIDMNLVAILENAYGIGYEAEANNLWSCWFTLPLNDPKRKEVTAKRFIELWDHDKRIGMFIINPKRTVKNESTREITYQCEHVLSTLHSDILFKQHQFTNIPTETVLRTLLELQEVKHWELGTVEFTRYFHHFFENEDSLLNALFTIPKSFDESYLWTWDDTKYPFTLNLVRPKNEKVDVIRAGKNLKGIEIEEDPTNLITRIYPLGAGEGVNQLTIESVNNGVPYLEAEPEIIEQYGVHKRIWVDRRFKDAESLKQSGKAILEKYKKPIKTVAVDLIDYRHLDPYKVLDYNPGNIVGVYDQDTDTEEDLRIMKINKRDIYGNPFDIRMEIGNVRENIGMTLADLQKKQLVNETYSQGATNLDSYTFNDNVDSSYPAIIEFPFPEDMVNLNESTLRIKTSKFRSYSKALKNAGQVLKTVTSTTAGQTTVTSSAGGGQTSSAGGDHTHKMFTAVGFEGNANPETSVILRAANGMYIMVNDGTAAGLEYYTEGSSGDHTHTVSDHTHEVTIGGHNHDVTINIDPHTHPIEYGIYEYNNLPTSLTVKIDGNIVPFNGLEGEIDIIPYLAKDSDGKVLRGYHTIEVIPDDLARINLILTNRFFIQSLDGGLY